MADTNLITEKLRIRGMTCTSCEIIITRELKRLPGVHDVKINYTTGWCELTYEQNAPLYKSMIRKKLTEHGYSLWDDPVVKQQHKQQRNWREFGVALILVFVVYKILAWLGVFSFSASVNDSISLGAVFMIGLVAAVSTCTALLSGLILSMSVKFNEVHPQATRWQRFRPHLMFNLGRVVSYFILGGVIGIIGKALTPSPRFTGLLTIVIAVVMILLGIDILKLFQGNRFIPKMPKWFSEKMFDLAESDRPWIPAVVGALTFFLPCGFTQAMQLYALTTGSFWQGGITMLVFALGTMPALVGVGMLASFAKGTFARYFMKFSGAMVLVLGIYNFSNGLALADIRPADWFKSNQVTSGTSTTVTIKDNKQVVDMAVVGLTYVPATITLKQGVPVEWRIDGSKAAGCAQIITIPSLGITKQLSTKGSTIITFTPTKAGPLNFSCTMGMARGSFNVIN